MGPYRLLKTIFAQFLGKYRVVSALFGKIERLTFTGTFDAFQHLVKSHSFKQICFPHRSEMGVLKSFLNHIGPFWNNSLVVQVLILAIAIVAHSRPSITTSIYLVVQCKSCIRVLMHKLMRHGFNILSLTYWGSSSASRKLAYQSLQVVKRSLKAQKRSRHFS